MGCRVESDTVIRPFISYAHEDMVVALRLWRDLRALGVEPWLDREELIGGQRWEDAVRDALDVSTHFLALISACSISKRGFVQKELAQALEILKEFPPDSIYVIPVRLDDTRPKHRILRELHWIDLFRDYASGVTAIAKSLGISNPRTPAKASPESIPPEIASIIATYAREQAGGDTAVERELLAVERDAWVRLQNIAPLGIRRSEVDRILDQARGAFPDQFGNQLFRVLNDITRALGARKAADTAGRVAGTADRAQSASGLSAPEAEDIPPQFRYSASPAKCPRCSGPAIYETDDDPNHMSAAISCQACGFYTADGYG